MKKILIIGAGFLQSFVIRKAKEMGYKVLAVDANPEAVGFSYSDGYRVIDIVDEVACLKYAREEKIDGVLTAATDYGVLTASYIAQQMGLPGLNYSVAKLIKNKYEVKRRLYDCHVDDTEQSYPVSCNTDLEKLCGKLKFPVMVKPCDGSGSRGASRVNFAEDFARACNLAMAASITHRAVVETFIEGREYGAECLVTDDGIHLLGIMRKWMTEPPYYAELGHAVPSDLSTETKLRVEECVRGAIAALGINFGSVNMDMIITPNGKVYIVDIGARMGGNMIGPCIIPYGTGIDYMANMIRNAVGDSVNLVSNGCKAVATRLLAFGNGIVGRLPDFCALEKRYGVEIYHHLKVGQQVNEYHTNLDGCGYIVAKSESIEEAIEKAENVLKYIRDFIFE